MSPSTCVQKGPVTLCVSSATTIPSSGSATGGVYRRARGNASATPRIIHRGRESIIRPLCERCARLQVPVFLDQCTTAHLEWSLLLHRPAPDPSATGKQFNRVGWHTSAG